MFANKEVYVNRFFSPVYLFFLSIALFIQQFLPGYKRYSSIEAISYKMSDGWCEPQKEGIGVHCFGDFYYPLRFVSADNPWKGVINPYPPISTFLYKPFDLLAQFTLPRVSLALWLFLLLCSLLFPVLHLKFVAREISTQSFTIITLVTLTCAPALMSIDRGNNLLFLVPPLYLFFRACLLNSEKHVLFFGLVCVSLKPQFAVLVVVIYQVFGLKKAFRWLLFSALVNFLSFLIYFKSFPENIFYWLYSAIGFQEYAARGILMPVNVSLKSDIDVALDVLNLSASGLIVNSVVYFLLTVFTIQLIRKIRKRSVIHNFTLVLFYPLLFTGTTYHYYLMILYIPFLFLFAQHIQPGNTGSLRVFRDIESALPSISKPLQGTVFLAFVIVSFIPWGIPWSAIFPELYGRGWDVIGANWVFSQYLLLALGITLSTQKTKGIVLLNGAKS